MSVNSAAIHAARSTIGSNSQRKICMDVTEGLTKYRQPSAMVSAKHNEIVSERGYRIPLTG